MTKIWEEPHILYRRADKHRLQVLERIDKLGYGHIIDGLTRCNELHSLNALARCVSRVSGREINAGRLKTAIKRMDRMAIGFTIDINYEYLDLKHIFVFIKNEFLEPYSIPLLDWIRLFTYTYNYPGTLIQYYAPIRYIDRFIDELRDTYGDGKAVITRIDDKMRSQPQLSREGPLAAFYELRDDPEKEAAELRRELDSLTKRTVLNYLQRKRRSKKHNVSMDLLDLLILRLLEKNAFINIRRVAQELPHTSRIVQRHFRNHVKQVIRGIYMKYTYINQLVDFVALVSLYVNNSYADHIDFLSNYLKSKNWVHGIAYGNNSTNDEPIIFIFTSIYKPNVIKLLELLNNYRKQDIINKYEILEIDMNKTQKYGIPYSNYDQYSRYWSFIITKGRRPQ